MSIPADKQQHMLLLFLPLRKGVFPELAGQANNSGGSIPPDLRAATGVHFAMFHHVPDGAASFLPVPTFQSAPGKDLLVALSLYDADFEPYISAFTLVPAIAQQLNLLLTVLDETGIVADDDPTSAAAILARGGVAQNNEQFIQLLLRYNFGDPNLSGAPGDALILPSTGQRYSFHTTFPGLTVGDVINNYPDAGKLWPWPPVAAGAAPELVAQ
jgi:hypothetical protein